MLRYASPDSSFIFFHRDNSLKFSTKNPPALRNLNRILTSLTDARNLIKLVIWQRKNEEDEENELCEHGGDILENNGRQIERGKAMKESRRCTKFMNFVNTLAIFSRPGKNSRGILKDDNGQIERGKG